jgi:hypothetical protein
LFIFSRHAVPEPVLAQAGVVAVVVALVARAVVLAVVAADYYAGPGLVAVLGRAAAAQEQVWVAEAQTGSHPTHTGGCHFSFSPVQALQSGLYDFPPGRYEYLPLVCLRGTAE